MATLMKPTQEQGIAWAREAGIKINPESAYAMEMHRFAILAYEAGQESMKWDGIHSCHPDCQRPACVHTRKAVEAEREACAKVCDELEYDGYEMLPRAPRMARLIRARGQE